jgi:hypothetical protein
MAYRIQFRRDTSANWETYNPILLQGEFGYELDTGFAKIGDGSTPWDSLEYFGGTGPTGPSGIPVSSIPPGSTSASGTTGQLALDSTHLYVCVGTNSWLRTNLTSW